MDRISLSLGVSVSVTSYLLTTLMPILMTKLTSDEQQVMM